MAERVRKAGLVDRPRAGPQTDIASRRREQFEPSSAFMSIGHIDTYGARRSDQPFNTFRIDSDAVARWSSA